ncbi:MAG: rhodanese-like domain-containing protein [Blastocatellia bacterium]
MAQATQQGTIRRVRADEIMQRMDRGEPVVFVDSRNPRAWSQSNERLPGAIRIPAGEAGRHLDEIPEEGRKDRWIVTYCT